MLGGGVVGTAIARELAQRGVEIILLDWSTGPGDGNLSEIIAQSYPIGSMYGIYANIGGILMVNVTIYGIHGSYGYE